MSGVPLTTVTVAEKFTQVAKLEDVNANNANPPTNTNESAILTALDGQLYTVLGKQGESLPWLELRLVVEELARQTKK